MSEPRRLAARKALLTVEVLEDRCVPAGIHFNYTIDDPTNAFAAFPLLRSNLEASGQIIGNLLDGQGSLEVTVRATTDVSRSGGQAMAVVYSGYQNGTYVYDNGTVSEARTGVDPNGAAPDIQILINPRDYLPLCWFDPSGAARTATQPTDKIDFLSVAIHETLHSLGIQGLRAVQGTNYGTFPDLNRMQFDALSRFGAGSDPSVMYFTGINAESLYGGPVPLTSVGANNTLSEENFYHLGNPAGHPGSELIGDMMNGVEFRPGVRYQISNLDLTILADLGWSLTPQAPAAVRAIIEANRPKPPPPPPPSPPPALPLTGDVTRYVRVILGKARYNTRTKQYERSAAIVNEGTRTIVGSLSVLFDVTDPSSKQHRTIRLTLAIKGPTLQPGATLSGTLTSANPAFASAPTSIMVIALG
jgi:hypothetical protein